MLRNVLLLFFLVSTTSAPADAAWRQASTDHFVVYSEASEKDLRAYATRLERLDQAMRLFWRAKATKPSPSSRLTIFAVRDTLATMSLYGTGADVQGFYIGSAGGSVAFAPRMTAAEYGNKRDADRILFHEYAHHFMLQNLPGAYPGWYMEGFADFNSSVKFERNGSVSLGLPARHWAPKLLEEKKISVLGALAASAEEQDLETLYTHGWLLTHFLTLEPARRGQLSAYLAQLAKGRNGAEAAKAAFGDLDELNKQAVKYLRAGRLPYVTIPADRLVPQPVDVRSLSPGEAASMAVFMRLARGVDEPDARQLLAAARATAARFQQEILPQLVLAKAALAAGNLDEADAAADASLSLEPDSVPAMLLKANLLLKRASAEGEHSANWKNGREWLLKVNRIEQDNSEALFLYYRTFLLQGLPPTPNAVAALMRAHELAPQDLELRMMVARQHLIDSNASGARAALLPIALDPHSGGKADLASKMIAALDHQGTAAALNIM